MDKILKIFPREVILSWVEIPRSIDLKNCSIVIENEGFQKRIGRCESRIKKMAGEKERGNSDSTRDRSRGSKGEASRTPGYHRDFPREGKEGFRGQARST